MQIACVLITHLEAKVELRRHPQWQGKPGLIIARGTRRPQVLDYLPSTRGVTVGMTLEHALSYSPTSHILDADIPYYHKIFAQVLTALQGVSDRVEGAELGTAFLDVAGAANLYGDVASLERALLEAIPPDLNARIGLAEGKFPAYMAARSAQPLQAVTMPADTAAFLAAQPIRLLPLAAEIRTRMHRFGLYTMGDVTRLSRRLLQDQFGPAGKLAWELSHGWDDTPLEPLAHNTNIVEGMAMPFHTTSVEALQAALDVLLKRAFARPWMRGRCTGQVDVSCMLSGMPSWEHTFHIHPGAQNWEQASYVLGTQLETDVPEAPIEEVTLTLSHFTMAGGLQMGLLDKAPDDRKQRLEEVERRLATRFGSHALYQVVEIAPWHPAPERRALQISLDTTGQDAIKPVAVPTPVAVREGAQRQPVAVQLKKRWLDVAAISDRWTFDLWWLPQPLTRTYYEVVSGDGRHTTLFRDQQDDCWYRQNA